MVIPCTKLCCDSSAAVRLHPEVGLRGRCLMATVIGRSSNTYLKDLIALRRVYKFTYRPYTILGLLQAIVDSLNFMVHFCH